ncbi:unnamed protein product [Closterium sp. NIES-65]|nr:unnamed protein product [Closterium sp. NIES-65]
MRIGGASDPVYDEYTAALGDEMKGMAAEFKALDLATNNVQVHTAVAIPRTRGGELVAKGTFVKASPRERWYSNGLLATAHPDDVFCFHEINFLPSRLPKTYIPDKRNVCERIVSIGILYNATGSCSAVPLVVLSPYDRPERRRGRAASRMVAVRYTHRGRLTPEVFTEFVETVNGVHFSRDRNTLILTIHEAHRITDEVARPVSEHGFSVQHLTNTRVVNIRGSVPEGGLPHLQGVEDALKAHYRVMLMKRAIAAKRFQFDYAASIADVDYGLMLEWLGESWTRVRAATMQRSWWRAGCVPPSWPPLMAYLNDTSATGMFEPLIATCVELQLLIEKFKMRPACYMTAAEFVNCDAGLCVEQGFVATPAASASDDSSGEMSLPDGPLLRDERSRRRVICNVTNAYVERADELGIPPALVPAEVGASNQEVISRLGRTPVKRALVANLNAGNVRSILGGDPGADGLALIQVYSARVNSFGAGNFCGEDFIYVCLSSPFLYSFFVLPTTPPIPFSPPHPFLSPPSLILDPSSLKRYNGQTNVNIRVRAHALPVPLSLRRMNQLKFFLLSVSRPLPPTKRYNGQTNVNIRLRAHALSSSPIAQTVNKGLLRQQRGACVGGITYSISSPSCLPNTSSRPLLSFTQLPINRYNGQTNVNIRLRAHALSSSPIAQTVNKAYSGNNGLPVWVVSGQWARDNSNDAYTLQKWYYEANKKYPPGSTSSVYSIVRAMAGDPRRYYAVVSSVTRPLGAIRGQFRRTLPFLLYPWNPC